VPQRRHSDDWKLGHSGLDPWLNFTTGNDVRFPKSGAKTFHEKSAMKKTSTSTQNRGFPALRDEDPIFVRGGAQEAHEESGPSFLV
jgi:hypothetical protein